MRDLQNPEFIVAFYQQVRSRHQFTHSFSDETPEQAQKVLDISAGQHPLPSTCIGYVSLCATWEWVFIIIMYGFIPHFSLQWGIKASYKTIFLSLILSSWPPPWDVSWVQYEWPKIYPGSLQSTVRIQIRVSQILVHDTHQQKNNKHWVPVNILHRHRGVPFVDSARFPFFSDVENKKKAY